MAFRDTIREHFEARTCGIAVESYEEDRVEKELRACAKKSERKFYTWSVISGLHDGQREIAPGPLDIVTAVNALVYSQPPGMIVFLDPHEHMSSANTKRVLKEFLVAQRSGSDSWWPVFLSPEHKIPIELSRIITKIPFELPSIK